MSRIACIVVPDIYLRAHLRMEPELERIGMVIVDDGGARSRVLATSVEATKRGIVPGMEVRLARDISDGLIVRPLSEEAMTAAIESLADVASTVSSRVEISEPDQVYLDCSGGGFLWRSESELARMIEIRAARQGLPVWIGIADSKLGANVAAREGGSFRLIPSGRTREFLAPLSLTYLEPDPASAATLASWGVRSIGALAALPSGAVAHRLGPAGVELVRRARGENNAPLVGRRVPETFLEAMALEYGLDNLEPLVFVLRRLIESVIGRIKMHGLGCRELEIGFELEGGGHDLRTVPAAAPTTEHRVFVTLVRAHLETSPPARPVTKVSVIGVAIRIRSTQLDLLRPAAPEPAALAATLARLSILCGSERVGVLRSADSHRPEAIEVGPFDGDGAAMSCEHAPDADASSCSGDAPPVVYMALRAYRPPVSVEVFESAGALDYVRGSGFGGRVVHRAGPWRLRGEWWGSEPFAREYYDVELSDGGVYRIYRDVQSGQWWADGVYD